MRRRSFGEHSKFYHRADQRLDLERPSRFNILQHRSLMRPDFLRARNALLDSHAHRDAELRPCPQPQRAALDQLRVVVGETDGG